MLADRPRRNPKLPGHLHVGLALGDEGKDLHFPGGEHERRNTGRRPKPSERQAPKLLEMFEEKIENCPVALAEGSCRAVEFESGTVGVEPSHTAALEPVSTDTTTVPQPPAGEDAQKSCRADEVRPR